MRLAPFAAAIERRDQRSLAEQPLLLLQDQHVVAGCERAAQSGVAPGMAVRAALHRCPSAHCTAAHPLRYREVEGMITRRLSAFSPYLEAVGGPQERHWFIGLERVDEAGAIPLVREIGRAVRDLTRLPPAVGLATGRLTAQLAAASVAPERGRWVAPGEEAAFLVAQPVEVLPLPEGMARRLHHLGLHTVGQFAALPPAAVLRQWGHAGRYLHRMARGESSRPERLRLTTPAVQVTHHLDEPLGERPAVEALVAQLARSLAWKLNEERRAARILWLRVTLDDRSTHERRYGYSKPLSGEREWLQGAQRLLAQLRLPAPVTSVQLLATDLSPLAPSAAQLSLFDAGGETAPWESVYPYLRARFGTDRFLAISLTDPEALIPERGFENGAWTMSAKAHSFPKGERAKAK